MLQIYRGLNIVGTDVRKLAAVEAPLNAAAYEMEVNVNGIGLAALKHLATGNPRYRALVEEDQVDFANYHATYMRLIRTERERALGADIMRLYAPFGQLARDLMDSRDRQEAIFAQVGRRLEAIDSIIDDRLQRPTPASGAGELPPSEWSIDYDSLDQGRDEECLPRSTSRRRL